jgi:hypothetical protein
VTIGLTVASLLARRIAAANSTDGGLSDLAVANHELLKIALEKLDRIESLLGRVYELVARLPEEIDNLLKRHETQELQTQLAATIIGYRELVNSEETHSHYPYQQVPQLQMPVLP